MIPKNRVPTSPGEMLRTEFLEAMGLTQGQLAQKMGVPIQRVNLIINERRAITAETAWLLSKALGTSPEFWMNLQMTFDLWHARRELSAAGAL